MARALKRSQRRLSSGAFGAIRRAALGLAGSDGQSTFTHQQLLRHPAAVGYAETTVIEAIQEHANGRDGILTRLQVGVYRLRRPGEAAVADRRLARDWVLETLPRLQAQMSRPVSRREIEQELEAMGLRYSARAVRNALTTLVRDPASGVTVCAPGRYRLGVDPGPSLGGRKRSCC